MLYEVITEDRDFLAYCFEHLSDIEKQVIQQRYESVITSYSIHYTKLYEGLMFISLSYLVFSLIEGIFGNVALLFSDMLMGLLIGMVFAIIAANFGKSSRTRVKTQKTRRIQYKKARV